MPSKKKPCVHHWVLGESATPEVAGVCKHCKAKKTFNQRITDYESKWRRDTVKKS